MKNAIRKISGSQSSDFGASIRWSKVLHSTTLIASLVAGLLSALAAVLADLGLRTSFSEIRIRPEYVPFVATILSAIVGLAMIFILARTFYKKLLQSRARLAKRVRSQEAKLFELAARDFDVLVGAHGRR
jgi:hypothetical protein